MATATNYIYTFVGGNRTFSISGYSGDTAGAINTFNPNGVAGTGSPNFWIPPVDVVLKDLSIVTGMVQTTQVLTENGATKSGTTLSIASHLNTLANRAPLSIPFKAGTQIGTMTI